MAKMNKEWGSLISTVTTIKRYLCRPVGIYEVKRMIVELEGGLGKLHIQLDKMKKDVDNLNQS